MALVFKCVYACVASLLCLNFASVAEISFSNERYYHYVVLPTTNIRTRRYLAGDYEPLSREKFALAPLDHEHGEPGGQSGGGAVPGIPTISHAEPTGNNSSNSTSEHEATRIPQVPVSENEPRTGGNYMSIKDAALQNATMKNNSDLNRTQPKQPTSAMPPVEANATHQLNGGNNATKEVSTESIESTTHLQGKANISTPDVHIDDGITITKFPDGNLPNKTLSQHNITKENEDHHIYYNSTFNRMNEELGHFYWVDMRNNSKTQINDMLSQSHRRAATVMLSFNFSFYGHIVRNVTIATGGFLYTGDYVHSWLAATQYIAPLMANFDTGLSNESHVMYLDNGTQFTVEWENVLLQDKPDAGVFTFQTTLKNNGDIIFVYKHVPVVIANITDDKHPVKVGLSDAYIIDRTILFVRRKTIYEYHRVNFDHPNISNWTVIYLKALPTCLNLTDCDSCLSRNTGFDCTWCPETSRCSNGIDRYRQEWLIHGCGKQAVSDMAQCPVPTSTSETMSSSSTESSGREHNVQNQQPETVTALIAEDSSSISVSSLIGILFFVALLMLVSLWAFYAYRNPHTASGQLLIKYRPSQWSWRRGEARYTAATIHM